MTITEIILLIAGAVVLLLGYVLPAAKEEKKTAAPQIDEEEIKKIIENEVDHARGQIQDVVEETVTYSMEKTERAMERLTNEKIMAVNEYSDTVLETINRNHKETVFLYDMLNDKHDDLVAAAGKAAQTVNEIRQAAGLLEQPADGAGEELERQNSPAVQKKRKEEHREKKAGKATEPEEAEFIPISPERVIIGKEKETPDVEISFADKEENNNEKILSLHKLGKSKTAIARELGLGVGEVKLVIDLFEGM